MSNPYSRTMSEEVATARAFAHTDELRNALAHTMSGKVKIYLDTRYWILLRDHVLGARTSEAISKTYDLIKNACASGIAICPIGEDVLYEVTKQTVPVSLLTTVRLIDTLSQGVCSLSHNERVRAEALASLSQGEFGYIEGVGVPVWTKLPFFLRSFVPVAPALGADQSQIQIAFTNHLWEISLEAMLNSAGPGFVENYPRYPNLSSLMNQDYDERKDEFNSFQKVFMSELRWEVERFVPEFEAAMADIYYRKSGRVVAQESADAEEARRVLRNVVYKSKEERQVLSVSFCRCVTKLRYMVGSKQTLQRE